MLFFLAPCTLKQVWQNYIWLELHMFVKCYCASCVTCKCSKSPQHKPYEFLKPLPTSPCPWDPISIDFIKQLPPSSGFTTILIMVNCLLKQGIFMPTVDTIDSEQLMLLFIMHIYSKHRVPNHVTSNHGTEFISCFTCALGKALDMCLHFTSRYHPQANGQTEGMNQTLKQYLQMYCNYCQSDWSTLLVVILD